MFRPRDDLLLQEKLRFKSFRLGEEWEEGKSREEKERAEVTAPPARSWTCKIFIGRHVNPQAPKTNKSF